MRTVYVFVASLPPPLEDEQREPGDVVAVRPDPVEGRLVIYMKSGTDENTLARELSYAVTVHVKREWMHVGVVVDAA